jgi:glycosyltransferase involved in cell wall biosynthesis
MPTANRRHYVPQAIRYFMAQDYPNRELVILDDGSESVADLVPDDPHLRYVRLAGKRTLGAKRNECVKHARGDLIMHWDDDDWMASHRISYQVEAMLREKAEVCGLRSMLFYEIRTGRVWLYEYPARQRPWLAGGSLLYTKDFWRRGPFPNIQIASDTRFVWNQRLDAAVLKDYSFYVAMIHPGNTSRKNCKGSYWKHWNGDAASLMREDLEFYRTLAEPAAERQSHKVISGEVKVTAGPPIENKETCMKVIQMKEPPPTFSIIMVVHNGLEMTKLTTLRTLGHSAHADARLVVVDNASTDGTGEWLDMLARRGDIDLIRSQKNIGHGPGIELALKSIRSPYIVTLDSDAFPLTDDWLSQLRARLEGRVKATGILHHRDYIHPSCLMIARETLDQFKLTFLNEKDRPSKLDVAERLSHEIRRRGYEIAGLRRTGALRRGSISEPVYLGSDYEGIVYHQWYTTRARIAPGRPVDDVPLEAIESSMRELFEAYHGEARDITVVMGVRASRSEPQRLRNALACLRALNLQDLPRWRYRLVVVEQDRAPQLESTLSPLADRYLFAYNPGPYNRGWAFNIGAVQAAGSSGILCLTDADLLAPPDFLSRALSAMRDGRRALLPYSELLFMDGNSTEQAIKDRQAAPLEPLDVKKYRGQLFSDSQGVCILVDAAFYQELGGYEERFRGWGREDREFYRRLLKATTVERLPGRLLHLDHPRPAMNDRWALANRRLYNQLAADPGANPARPIGDFNLYAGEKPKASASAAATATATVEKLGRRAWEYWHTWDRARIERVVQTEKNLHAEASARRHLADIATKLGDSMLDVGCGPGALWVRLEPSAPRFSWTGVDATPEMLAVARRLFPRIPVHHADAGALPFDDRSFDVVLLRHVLEHLPDWLMEKALEEAMRTARRAVVLDFYITPTALKARHNTAKPGRGYLEMCWTVEDIETPIRKLGWTIGKRLNLQGGLQETNDVWILTSPEQPVPIDLDSFDSREELKISIIMPTYRRPHTIHRTIEMIKAQTYRNWELIVVDNGGDGEYQFDDPRIKVYSHAEQPGASFARNQGLRYATGDLVCFFDDDDDMFPRYLERFIDAFRSNPKAKMVRCGMYVTSGQKNFTFATPECCLRRRFAKPAWVNKGPGQDQRYFRHLIKLYGWSEQRGDIVTLNEVLCRANADPSGGLRAGKY